MESWAKPPERREQMVLFSTRLDDVLPPDHVVRLLDELLSRMEWSAWEAEYDHRRGRPSSAGSRQGGLDTTARPAHPTT
jgi:transposase